jgi:hypothetical protein
MDARTRIEKGISGETRTLFLGEADLPANSGYTTLLDTTRKWPSQVITDGLPVSATLPTVGTGAAGVALGKQYSLLVSCTGQNCTVLQYVKHADGAWKLFASTVITADADPQSFTWDPSALNAAEDVLAVVLAGATAPTKIYASVIERTVR